MGWMFCGFWWRSFPSSNNVVKMYSKVTWSTSMLKLAACNFLLLKTFQGRFLRTFMILVKYYTLLRILNIGGHIFLKNCMLRKFLIVVIFSACFSPLAESIYFRGKWKLLLFGNIVLKPFFFFSCRNTSQKAQEKINVFPLIHLSCFMFGCSKRTQIDDLLLFKYEFCLEPSQSE